MDDLRPDPEQEPERWEDTLKLVLIVGAVALAVSALFTPSRWWFVPFALWCVGVIVLTVRRGNREYRPFQAWAKSRSASEHRDLVSRESGRSEGEERRKLH